MAETSVILKERVVAMGGSCMELTPYDLDADMTAGTLFNPSIICDGEGGFHLSFRHAPQLFVQRRYQSTYNFLWSAPPVTECNHVRSDIYGCTMSAELCTPGKTEKMFPGFVESLDNKVQSIEDFRFARCSSDVVTGFASMPHDSYREVPMCVFEKDLRTGEYHCEEILTDRLVEKNWQPVLVAGDNGVPVLYMPDVSRSVMGVVDVTGRTMSVPVSGGSGASTGPQLGQYRGSSQLVPTPEGDGFLTLWHYTTGVPYLRNWQYWHVFVKIDEEGRTVRISKPFLFEGFNIEFCCGLAYYNDNYYVTYSVMDSAPMLLRVPRDVMNALLFDDFIKETPAASVLYECYDDRLLRYRNAGWLFTYFNLCQFFGAAVKNLAKAAEYYRRADEVIDGLKFPFACDAERQRNSLRYETLFQLNELRRNGVKF